MADQNMANQTEATGWWRRESQRDFTQLERGLMGALFVAIAVMAVMLVRYLI